LLQALLIELVAMALLFAITGAYQYATRDVFWNPKVIVSNAYAPYFRVNSVFWDPSVYGRFLVIAILAALVIVLATTRRFLIFGASAAISVVWIGLALSFSQSSFAALIIGVAAAALAIWRRQALIPLFLAAALAVGATLATPAVRHRLFDRSSGGLSDVSGSRYELVSGGVHIALDHPLIGVGVGGFKHAYAERTGLKGREPRKAASHTAPVTVAAETGIVGLALFSWLVAASLAIGYRRAGREFEGNTALVGALALTAIVIHSLSYSDFFEDPMVWGLFALIVSAPLALVGEARPSVGE
jgi:hypothetical protein